MWRALVLTAAITAASGAAAARDIIAAEVVNLCGGVRMTLGSDLEFEVSGDDWQQMAAVLEERLDIWPDPLINVVPSDVGLQVDLPLGLGDPSARLDDFLRQGVLGAFLVEEVTANRTPVTAPPNARVWQRDDQPQVNYWQLGSAVFDASDVKAAQMASAPNGVEIWLKLHDHAAAAFEVFTEDNLGKMMVIVLDDQVLIAAMLLGAIPDGELVITGAGLHEEAEATVRLLNTGTLAHPLYLSSLERIAPGNAARCSDVFLN